MDEIQIAEINSQVRRYLEGTLEEIDVRSPSGPPCLAGQGCLGHTMMYLCVYRNLTEKGTVGIA